MSNYIPNQAPQAQPVDPAARQLELLEKIAGGIDFIVGSAPPEVVAAAQNPPPPVDKDAAILKALVALNEKLDKLAAPTAQAAPTAPAAPAAPAPAPEYKTDPDNSNVRIYRFNKTVVNDDGKERYAIAGSIARRFENGGFSGKASASAEALGWTGIAAIVAEGAGAITGVEGLKVVSKAAGWWTGR
jgi:hypothetical protein